MASAVMVAAAVQEDLGGSKEEWVARVVPDPGWPRRLKGRR